MNVIHEEALDSYDADIVREMNSNTVEEMDENVDAVKQFVDEFRQEHAA